MEALSIERTCPNCGRSYHIALRKMRVNIHNLCPVCGFPHHFSHDDAIKAQRLLEKLELEERVRSVA